MSLDEQGEKSLECRFTALFEGAMAMATKLTPLFPERDSFDEFGRQLVGAFIEAELHCKCKWCVYSEWLDRKMAEYLGVSQADLVWARVHTESLMRGPDKGIKAAHLGFPKAGNGELRPYGYP